MNDILRCVKYEVKKLKRHPILTPVAPAPVEESTVDSPTIPDELLDRILFVMHLIGQL